MRILISISFVSLSCFQLLSQQDFNFERLIGTWQRNLNDTLFNETWVKVEEDEYKISGVERYKPDTLFYENISLINRNQKWLCIVFTENANPVLFNLTQVNGDEAVFVNPEHDYPKKIKYEQKTKDKLDVTLYGAEDKDQLIFKMKKIK